MYHVNPSLLIHNRLPGEELLVIFNLARGFLGVYPVRSKSAERVLMVSFQLSGLRPATRVLHRSRGGVRFCCPRLSGMALRSQDQHPRSFAHKHRGVPCQSGHAGRQDASPACRNTACLVALCSPVRFYFAQTMTRLACRLPIVTAGTRLPGHGFTSEHRCMPCPVHSARSVTSNSNRC